MFKLVWQLGAGVPGAGIDEGEAAGRTAVDRALIRWRHLDPARQALLALAHLRNGDVSTRPAGATALLADRMKSGAANQSDLDRVDRPQCGCPCRLAVQRPPTFRNGLSPPRGGYVTRVGGHTGDVNPRSRLSHAAIAERNRDALETSRHLCQRAAVALAVAASLCRRTVPRPSRRPTAVGRAARASGKTAGSTPLVGAPVLPRDAAAGRVLQAGTVVAGGRPAELG